MLGSRGRHECLFRARLRDCSSLCQLEVVHKAHFCSVICVLIGSSYYADMHHSIVLSYIMMKLVYRFATFLHKTVTFVLTAPTLWSQCHLSEPYLFPVVPFTQFFPCKLCLLRHRVKGAGRDCFTAWFSATGFLERVWDEQGEELTRGVFFHLGFLHFHAVDIGLLMLP